MAVLGSAVFTAFVWANVLLVMVVFGYEMWALLGERKAVFG